MSKAFNLSLLANNVNSSGLLDGGAVNGPVASATTATTATTATSATTATTAGSTPILQTTNFSISEVGGKLVFKYGTTVIASMDSSGNITSVANVTAYGTP
jgi:hypothetical protein